MKTREPYLIAYFAVKGKEETAATARVSAQIAKVLTEKGVEFDQFAIVPTEVYPEDPVNLEMATKAEKSSHARPELVGKYSGMKDVKGIILVTPNWWNSLPQGVFTFFDRYDFSEKKIVPVVVSAGDGAGNIVDEIRSFIHKTWVLPAVEIKDSEIDNDDPKIQKAVEELFQPSTSKY